ncbi:MAG: PAS domain-containing protein [Paludibacter sp.]
MNIADINTLARNEILKKMSASINTTNNQIYFQHRLASRAIRDVEVCSSPIETLGKNVLFLVVHDITNRKKVEKEICNEKKKLADILVGTNTGCWEWKIPNGELNITETWAKIIGYTIEEISPISIKTWIKFIHPDDLILSKNLLIKYFRGENDSYVFEGRMKHKNGNWIWIVGRGKVHEWDNNGHPIFMSGTHQDITKQKEIENEHNMVYLKMKNMLRNQM